jgi:hypothetical protein
MKSVNRLLWAILVTMLACLTFLVIETFGPKAVCHSITEDSDITDCSYHDGTWWTK